MKERRKRRNTGMKLLYGIIMTGETATIPAKSTDCQPAIGNSQQHTWPAGNLAATSQLLAKRWREEAGEMTGNWPAERRQAYWAWRRKPGKAELNSPAELAEKETDQLLRRPTGSLRPSSASEKQPSVEQRKPAKGQQPSRKKTDSHVKFLPAACLPYLPCCCRLALPCCAWREMTNETIRLTGD